MVPLLQRRRSTSPYSMATNFIPSTIVSVLTLVSSTMSGLKDALVSSMFLVTSKHPRARLLFILRSMPIPDAHPFFSLLIATRYVTWRIGQRPPEWRARSLDSLPPPQPVSG